MVWDWNLYKNYFWLNLFIRDTAPIVAQEQQFSIQEEIIMPSIHCYHCCNIGLLCIQYRCSCFGFLRGGNPPQKKTHFLESSNLSNSSKKKVNRIALFSTKSLRKIWLLMKLGCKMMFFMCDWGLIINVFHW